MTLAEMNARSAEARRQRLELLGGGYGVKIPAGRMADLIEECPDVLARVEILDLLNRTQGFGTSLRPRPRRVIMTRGERFLYAEGITTNRRLGELSERQRCAVTKRLRLGR